jgi:methionine sulfoxide reductase heme-binding subunit
VSLSYRAVGWNPQKRRYDAALASSVAGLLVLLVGGGGVVNPNATIETLVIRALGVVALLLLHVVLSIGPLCRLDARFLPLLYNRRHLGVSMFLLALGHGVFAIVQFHGLADINPLVSLLTTSTDHTTLSGFPFQLIGLGALLVLFLMAATSHDFWLRQLTPPVWKTLHMGVYLAYCLIVLHVALGALQFERSPWLAALLVAGVLWVGGLHAAAALRERATDEVDHAASPYVDVCAVAEIPDGRAVVTAVAGERIAVFRYDGCVSAISNVCQHQNGPLGEGRIVNGCVVCPWHGYEYRPDTGAAPAPFTECVPTFSVVVREGRVCVDPRAHPPGTRVPPARVA